MNAAHATAPSRFNRKEPTLREGATVVPNAKDIILRSTDSDDTVARESKAALSMPEVTIGRYKSRRKADKAETARNVIWWTSMNPLDCLPRAIRGPTLEMCARISRGLNWVAVAQSMRIKATGTLEYIKSGKAPLLYG